MFGYFISHVSRPGRSRLVASLKRYGGEGVGVGLIGLDSVERRK